MITVLNQNRDTIVVCDTIFLVGKSIMGGRDGVVHAQTLGFYEDAKQAQIALDKMVRQLKYDGVMDTLVEAPTVKMVESL